MNTREFIAKLLFEEPVDDQDWGATWPPSHPEDREWWLTRADAVLPFVSDDLLDFPNTIDQKEDNND